VAVGVELVGVSGALETVTVVVPPPQAASSAAALASSTATLARSGFDLVLGPASRILRVVFVTRSGLPRWFAASPMTTPQPRTSCAIGRIIAAARPPFRIIISDC
jgi:hypothetical protein